MGSSPIRAMKNQFKRRNGKRKKRTITEGVKMAIQHYGGVLKKLGGT